MDSQMHPPLLSVIIPVYNEVQTIAEVLDRVQRVDIEKEIILVDDGSRDGTREILESVVRRCSIQTIQVFFHEKNLGKGAAVRRGFAKAKGRIILIQDADLEYNPEDYPKLLAPIQEGLSDVVYGVRVLESHRGELYWGAYIVNRLLTWLSNTVTKLNLSDVMTGYKVFRREVVENMKLTEDGFSFETEVTNRIAQAGWRVCEVPVSYRARSYAEGKKISWKDGIKGMISILRSRLC